jgi:hypothetical protein
VELGGTQEHFDADCCHLAREGFILKNNTSYCAILRFETYLADTRQYHQWFASFRGVGRISAGEENRMRYSYRSLCLDHPGLVAGMFDELGIGSH